MAYNNITDHYDILDYMDEIIAPTYYPEGTATLDKKWVKLWLSPDLNAMDDGGLNFSPQFWGDTAYGIILNHYIGYTDNVPLPDAISLSQFKALTADRRDKATNWGEKLNLARTYATYAPAVIGYDPVHDGFFGDLATVIGGTTSVSSFVRDSALDIYGGYMKLYMSTTAGIVQTFYFDAAGYDTLDPEGTQYMAYTVPPCYLDSLYPSQKAADLQVFFVISYLYPDDTPLSRQRYIAKWVIYSESTGYYAIAVAIPTFGGLNLPYGEPTNEPDEGDEPEVIDYPDPSTVIGINSGYLAVYKMDYTQVQQFASDMWDDNVLSQIGHLFGDNPNYSDVIISLGVLPFPDDLPAGGAVHIGIGNTQTPTATGFPVNTRIYTADFSSVYIPPIHNSFLDYAPYTTVTMYLPFIGYVQVAPQFVIGHTVTARYFVDVLTGGCTCCLKNDSVGVFAVHTGTCLYSIPVSQSQGGHWYDGIQNAITGGMNLSSSCHISSATTETFKYNKQGNLKSHSITEAGSRSIPAVGNVVSVAQHAFDTQTTVKGNVGGMNGFSAWTDEIPIWIETAHRADYGDYVSTKGAPVAQEYALYECTGFTLVDSINLRGLSATKPEIEELEMILKTGFIAPDAGISVTQPATTAPTSGLVTIDCYSRRLGLNQLNVNANITSINVDHVGAFRPTDTPNIVDPTIIVKASITALANCNYVHIAEFNRFYFVSGMVALTAETTMLMLHVDVLNSFWDSISSISAYIGRMNTENSNAYIIDNEAVLDSNTGGYERNVWTYELTHSHTPDVHGCYVLLTASH